MTNIEKIRHAAVKSVNGMILLGKSHSDCMWQAGYIGVEMLKRADAQGFFTSHGRFVDRKLAAEIAIAAGQVKDDVKILFSEDLWSPISGGKFEYDYIKGYYE